MSHDEYTEMTKVNRSCDTCKHGMRHAGNCIAAGCLNGEQYGRSINYSQWQPKPGKPVKCSTCDESFEKQRIENTNKLLDKLAKQEPPKLCEPIKSMSHDEYTEMKSKI